MRHIRTYDESYNETYDHIMNHIIIITYYNESYNNNRGHKCVDAAQLANRGAGIDM